MKKDENFELKLSEITIYGENGESVTFSDVDAATVELINESPDPIGDLKKAPKKFIKGRYSDE